MTNNAENAKTKVNTTPCNKISELVFILDRSGSMQGLEKDTIGGFNAMIEKQKGEEGECYVSTVLFDDSSTVLHDRIRLAEKQGLSSFPVCIAKTQYSFSGDEKAYGAVSGFDLHIRDVVINAGSEMIVAIAGNIMRMPGLPKEPQANKIDYINGEIIGLS